MGTKVGSVIQKIEDALGIGVEKKNCGSKVVFTAAYSKQ